MPNPQPGGPGDHSLSGLYPLTCSAWVALPGVPDSRRRSSRGHQDTQTAPPRYGGDPNRSSLPYAPTGAKRNNEENLGYIFWTSKLTYRKKKQSSKPRLNEHDSLPTYCSDWMSLIKFQNIDFSIFTSACNFC